MACFVVGLIRVLESQAFERYKSRVAETLGPFNAELVTRSESVLSLWDEHQIGPLDSMVLLKFDTASAAQNWADSAAYRALLADRQLGARLTLLAFE